MNTDPLWQALIGLAALVFIIGFVLIGFFTNYDKNEEWVPGCLFLTGSVLGLLVSALYIFWYLHVKVVF